MTEEAIVHPAAESMDSLLQFAQNMQANKNDKESDKESKRTLKDKRKKKKKKIKESKVSRKDKVPDEAEHESSLPPSSLDKNCFRSSYEDSSYKEQDKTQTRSKRTRRTLNNWANNEIFQI